jgi:hypothetical protein
MYLNNINIKMGSGQQRVPALAIVILVIHLFPKALVQYGINPRDVA